MIQLSPTITQPPNTPMALEELRQDLAGLQPKEEGVAMNLLVKTDPELGYAYFCPACKSFLCNTEEICRFCGQPLDWAAEKVPYDGRVKWPMMEELAYRRKPEEDSK